MPNNCLSVLYKHIIQVENKNVGLKVGGGGHKHTIAPPIKKVWGGGHMPPLPPASCPCPPLPTPVLMINNQISSLYSAVVMSSANRLVGTGFVYRYRLQPRVGFQRLKWVGVRPLHSLLSH